MTVEEDARTLLLKAAWGANADKATAPMIQRLCDAATVYASMMAPPPAVATPAKSRSGFLVPFGKSQGTPIEDATKKDLQYLEGSLSRSVDDPEKAQWREKNQALLDGIRAELVTR